MTNRFNNAPLSNEQLMRFAPSIFATKPSVAVSDKYAFIPTVAVLDRMRSEGFQPVEASQSLARTIGGENYAKHMIRFRDFRNGALPATRTLGQVYPELVLTNSHNGDSRYWLNAGLFRLVCLNGAVASDAIIPGVAVRHTGNVDGIIEASFEVIDQTPKLIDAVGRYQRLQLSAPQATAYATAALQLRYDDGQAPIDARQVLQARRAEDAPNSLWNVFNRTQEALVTGGLRGRTAETGRRLRTRPVTGISENLKLNKALWTLTEEMAKIVS